MKEIERFQSAFRPNTSFADHLPYIGKERKKKQLERGEDELSNLVVAKLMSHLSLEGITTTYFIDRELFFISAGQKENKVADIHTNNQEQRVMLKDSKGNLYRAKLNASQSFQGESVTSSDLGLSIKDYIPDTGNQRFLAYAKGKHLPSFFNSKKGEHQARYYYGMDYVNGKYDRISPTERSTCAEFQQEVMGLTVDPEATKKRI